MLLRLQRIFTTDPLLNWQNKRMMSPALTSWQRSSWQLLPLMFHLCEASVWSRRLFPHTGCACSIIKREWARAEISWLFLKATASRGWAEHGIEHSRGYVIPRRVSMQCCRQENKQVSVPARCTNDKKLTSKNSFSTGFISEKSFVSYGGRLGNCFCLKISFLVIANTVHGAFPALTLLQHPGSLAQKKALWVQKECTNLLRQIQALVLEVMSVTEHFRCTEEVFPRCCR